MNQMTITIDNKITNKNNYNELQLMAKHVKKIFIYFYYKLIFKVFLLFIDEEKNYCEKDQLNENNIATEEKQFGYVFVFENKSASEKRQLKIFFF